MFEFGFLVEEVSWIRWIFKIWFHDKKKLNNSNFSKILNPRQILTKFRMKCYSVLVQSRTELELDDWWFEGCTSWMVWSKFSRKFKIKKFERFDRFCLNSVPKGGGQNLERRNVERPIFQNFKIANIKITKNSIVLFSSLFFHF